MAWREYVASHLDGGTQKALAARAGIDENTLSAWMTGRSWPTYDRAVAFARGVGDSPVAALVMAGLLTPTEAAMPTTLPTIAEASTAALAAEVARRLAE